MLGKSSFFVFLVANVLSNRFILTSKEIYVKHNYQGRLQLRRYQSYFLQKSSFRALVDGRCLSSFFVSFHVSFLYESSSCGTCCQSKDKNTPAVFLRSLWQLNVFLFFDFFLFCLLLKRKAGK